MDDCNWRQEQDDWQEGVMRQFNVCCNMWLVDTSVSTIITHKVIIHNWLLESERWVNLQTQISRFQNLLCRHLHVPVKQSIFYMFYEASINVTKVEIWSSLISNPWDLQLWFHIFISSLLTALFKLLSLPWIQPVRHNDKIN